MVLNVIILFAAISTVGRSVYSLRAAHQAECEAINAKQNAISTYEAVTGEPYQ